MQIHSLFHALRPVFCQFLHCLQGDPFFVVFCNTYCWIAQIHCCVTPVDLEIPGSLRSFLPAKHLLSFKFYVSFFCNFFCTIASSPLSISLTLEDPIWPYIDGFTKHNLLWPGKVVLNMPISAHRFFQVSWFVQGGGKSAPRPLFWVQNILGLKGLKTPPCSLLIILPQLTYMFINKLLV